MTRFLALFLALPAHAETSRQWANGASHITIQQSDKPGAVAEIEFKNEAVHNDSAETFNLTLDGLTVGIDATVGRGMTPDDMAVTVPEGFIAVPPFVSVPEGESRVVVIYSTEGVGM